MDRSDWLKDFGPAPTQTSRGRGDHVASAWLFDRRGALRARARAAGTGGDGVAPGRAVDVAGPDRGRGGCCPDRERPPAARRGRPDRGHWPLLVQEREGLALPDV